VLRADVDEDEVCAAGPAAEAGLRRERASKSVRACEHFAYVPIEICRVFKRGRRQASASELTL
jgi:hypothetical protein